MNSMSEILNTKLFFYILNILHSTDSSVSGSYISDSIDGNISFNEWENEINIKTAETRWKRNVNPTLIHGRTLSLTLFHEEHLSIYEYLLLCCKLVLIFLSNFYYPMM